MDRADLHINLRRKSDASSAPANFEVWGRAGGTEVLASSLRLLDSVFTAVCDHCNLNIVVAALMGLGAKCSMCDDGKPSITQFWSLIVDKSQFDEVRALEMRLLPMLRSARPAVHTTRV